MRRCVPLLLLLLAVGCQSPEEKACDSMIPISQAALAANGRTDNRDPGQLQRGCLESLQRLRQQYKPDEDAWFTYLVCMRKAQDMGAQTECLAPLTATPVEAPASPK